jgi:DNA invertase Pin-like site-specific DNA recombinase
VLVGYARVSSADDRQTTDLQRDALAAAGVDPPNVFEDAASGARDDRPGLKRCLAHLAPGDVLVVWRLDRLGRSLSDLVEIVSDLSERGVGLPVPAEAIDTTTPAGEFLFHLFGALAQQERALARERVLAGREAARRRGRRGGRPRALGPDRVEAARRLLADGMSVAAAARALGVKRTTLADSLRRAGASGSGEA